MPGRSVFRQAPIQVFTGVFDGNGHLISRMTITGASHLGLFGLLESGGEVKDLGVVDVNITGSGWDIGGLVGYNGGGTVNCCYSTGAVSGGGGIVGGVGGLVGFHHEGIVTQCYSTGAVSGYSKVGGLAGRNYGDLTQCYSTGAVNGGSYVGGLAGFHHEGIVTQCYSTGVVSGDGDYVGGLVGAGGGTVSHSVWDMETSGLSGSAGGMGLTTREMMDPDMLGLNGFASDPNWVLDAGRDYPRLAWEGTPGQIIPEPDINWLTGQGTSEAPYRIDTSDQLILLGKGPILWDKHFVLGADIDLDPNLPGGRAFAQAVIPTFSGVFDGRGHKISRLTIIGGGYLGLFGQLGSSAEVSNLALEAVDVNGTGDVGGLAGHNAGSITTSYSSGSVVGDRDLGGLVGSNSGNITSSYSTGTVSGPGWWLGGVGGLAGRNRGDIAASYSTGTVTGDENVGGLVGFNSSSITASYSTSAVIGEERVGGFVGYNYGGSVTQCYSTGSVSGTGQYSVDGFAGRNYSGNITSSFWDVDTSGQVISDGGTGLTTAEMQMASTFLEASWDFVDETENGIDDIWWILEGRDYPRLWWEAAGQ
jgi:hypothetical protein